MPLEYANVKSWRRTYLDLDQENTVRFPARQGEIVNRPGTARYQDRFRPIAQPPGPSSRLECLEIGENHGGMSFDDGVEYVTGDTFGKGKKQPYGKLAVALVEKASNRALWVSYKSTLQAQIAKLAFMTKCGMGNMADEIPEAEQPELVDLMWNAPECDVLTIGEIFRFGHDWLPETDGDGDAPIGQALRGRSAERKRRQ
jgi:hypothetical protein